MTEYKLGIGDVVTSSHPALYTCYGLGSCIGLFVQDRVTGLAGAAHIFLPDQENAPHERNKFYDVKTALDEILAQFKDKGSTLNTLRAKIAGGANVIGTGKGVGAENASSVIRRLTENKIFIAAIDIGGSESRTTRFESTTGQLNVSKPGAVHYKI
ncbi:chemotaxis protein CheD [Chryseolinea lacunae]|uniref:Chemotaxis protein CheD n=1 Tax=Chryseolinea lacunae TaxID=2801331 RepID=A0ABS1KPE5_9BACT|nr:chemotaxis protein CheD [Chryseolinea lacunae]MBL0741103.1 chemotaxis protein CheD [Chryseolinea lacunae]